MIKTYAGFLENCEEMPDDNISLDEELKKAVLDNPGWHSAYVDDRPPEGGNSICKKFWGHG